MRGLKLRWMALGLSILLSSAYLIGAGGYHLLKKIPFAAALGGGEYFDYITVDSPARRVYLSHGTEIIVLDADSNAVVGKVSGGFKRNHGVALVPDSSRAFVTDGGTGKVVIFDTKTLKITGEAKADTDADYILYDPASKHVFAFNGEPHSATVIDAASGSVVSTVPLPGQPEQGVSDGKGMVYDNIESTNEVVALDSRTLQIKSHWPVAPGGQPVSIAMDREHRRLFIGCRNPKMLVVMNADTGKIIGQQFPIGDRVDTNIFEPSTGMLFSSTREGTIHIFHEDSPDKLSVVETVQTEFGAKTMGIDTKTHSLYVTTSDFSPAPPKTEKQPNPQPVAIPGTFRVLIYGR